MFVPSLGWSKGPDRGKVNRLRKDSVMADEAHHPKFGKLIDFLARLPAVENADTPSRGIGSGQADGSWWVKFSIDIDHDLAWHTVQELAHVLNCLSLEERLASVFKPVSPPPCLNGGPDRFLSWAIEVSDDLRPGALADVLEGRLPKPVEDEAAWLGEADDDPADDDSTADDDDDDEEEGPTGGLEDED
jgi:hypothetical protein